jgi:DNA-binding response OmpR family regulator
MALVDGDLAFDGGQPLRAGILEIKPSEGLALAGGRALRLSVLEFSLLAELVSNEGRIVTRSDLYSRVWRRPLREGDRTIDVYVHKLRVKLENALPDWDVIHTHVGFGYRLAFERSQFINMSTTDR